MGISHNYHQLFPQCLLTSTQFLNAIAAVNLTAMSELSPRSPRRWTRICQTMGNFAHSSSELTHSPINPASRRLSIRWLTSAKRQMKLTEGHPVRATSWRAVGKLQSQSRQMRLKRDSVDQERNKPLHGVESQADR
jgi:hypothetical protein